MASPQLDYQASHQFPMRGKVGCKEGHNWILWNANLSPSYMGLYCRVTDPRTNQQLDAEAVTL
jgi:hypothetical protein